MFRKLLSGGVVAGLATVGVMAGAVSSASDLPSGERTFGQTVLEPAYNDANGTLVYLSTPLHAAIHPNSHNTAPLYLPLYPVGSTVGTLNCAHLPADNCPDHGPQVAALAEQASPTVYGGGVLGHDHLVGIASTGGDFNVNWEPIAIIFTSAAAANQHLTTLSQVQAVLRSGQAIEIPLPPATFHCSVVSAAAYEHGTPVTPVG